MDLAPSSTCGESFRRRRRGRRLETALRRHFGIEKSPRKIGSAQHENCGIHHETWGFHHGENGNFIMKKLGFKLFNEEDLWI
jgi:hypothetical protein